MKGRDWVAEYEARARAMAAPSQEAVSVKGYVVRGKDDDGDPVCGADYGYTTGPAAPVFASAKEANETACEMLKIGCRDVRIFAVADDGTETPIPSYEEALAAADTRNGVGAALISLMTTMATSARDWSSSKDTAWLYGIVCGWDEAALADLAVAYDWPPERVERLLKLRAGFVRALPSGGEGR